MTMSGWNKPEKLSFDLFHLISRPAFKFFFSFDYSCDEGDDNEGSFAGNFFLTPTTTSARSFQLINEAIINYPSTKENFFLCNSTTREKWTNFFIFKMHSLDCLFFYQMFPYRRHHLIIIVMILDITRENDTLQSFPLIALYCFYYS